ncbi:MAG: PfkB family carbohydrate kinase [Ilumatobacteraceae bacterium]|nr:PfkB family carbohydrate kinase [Ilumatobacteraceae bacterium]
MSDSGPRLDERVCVFGPTLCATVTIEGTAGGASAVHFHPGGQAFWIARAINRLGARSVLVGPIGGESGVVLSSLMSTWDVDLIAARTSDESAAYVHDRRGGRRREVASSPGGTLSRHEIDDLYGRVIETGAAAGCCVVTGSASGDALGDDFYRRLGHDLHALGVVVVADLHGPELDAFVDGGAIDVLKVSHDDLIDDGRLSEQHDVDARIEVARQLCGRGVSTAVVSDPVGALLVRDSGDIWYAEPPLLEPVDHRGAGDAMTAALCVSTCRRDDVSTMLRLACAAGAATVTRHGLGNAEARVIDSIADSVALRRLAHSDCAPG